MPIKTRISCIYKIVNKITNDFYVGSTCSFYNRRVTHKYSLKNNIHTNSFLQNAVNKYGIRNFYFEILELCSKDNLFMREQYYIDSLNPRYNLLRKAGEIPKITRKGLIKAIKSKKDYFKTKHSKFILMYKDGRSASDIADSFNVTVDHVYKILSRNGFSYKKVIIKKLSKTNRKSPSSTRANSIRLANEKKRSKIYSKYLLIKDRCISSRQISNELGISRGYLRSIIKKMCK